MFNDKIGHNHAHNTRSHARTGKTRSCELCLEMRVYSIDETVCRPCDDVMRAQFEAEDNARRARIAHRKCRLCNGALPDSRYFACKLCISDTDMPGEDPMFERVEEYPSEYAEPVVNAQFRARPLPTEKLCRRCETTKPVSEFGRYRSDKPHSFRSQCNPCYAEYCREKEADRRAKRIEDKQALQGVEQ